MAYVSQQDKKEIAPVVKNILKKYNLKGSLSVRNRSTLVLTIKSGKIDFIKNYNDTMKGRLTSYDDTVTEYKNYLNVNTYWVHEHFTGEAKECLEELVAALKGPKYFDHSDPMTDYFHTSHYIDINVGQWNKPYVVTE
jgi:hypothetical protein